MRIIIGTLIATALFAAGACGTGNNTDEQPAPGETDNPSDSDTHATLDSGNDSASDEGTTGETEAQDTESTTETGVDSALDTESDTDSDSGLDTGSDSEVDTGDPIDTSQITCGRGAYYGDVNVNSQTELEAFYGYTEFHGNVWLEGVFSLEGMHCLERITGDFSIDDTYLETLNGLDNLRTTGDYLYIMGNDTLTDVRALSGITDPPDVMRVQYNPVLTRMDWGFLQVIEEFTFTHNYSATTLDLSSLLAVNKKSWARLDISSNYALTQIDLSALQTVSYSLRIAENHSLESLDLPAVETLPAHVYLDRNEQMNTFSCAATEIGSLSFYDTYVSQLDLPQLTTSIYDLNFSDLEVVNFNLPVLETVGGSLRIYVNPFMTSVSFPNLQTVGDQFELWSNYTLACDPAAISAQVNAIGGFDICGNGPGGACGPESCP